MAQQSPLVGSDAWTNGKEFHGPYAARIKHMQKAFDQNALIAYASALRDGRVCTLSSEFSVGTCNFVKKITFDDGVEWIARLRMPPAEEFEDVDPRSVSEVEKEKCRVLYEMQPELDTMELVRQHTDIPVPKVHGYNLNDSNPVGFPFSIMDYVHGNTAEEVSAACTGQPDEIPEQYEEKFWRQIAKIMFQLASVRLPKIGSIVRDSSSPGSFTVGQLVNTSSGPYDTAAEFYDDYPVALARSFSGEELRASGGEELVNELVEAFRSLASSSFSSAVSVDGKARSGFGLANCDLGPHNIIVDREFNVLAVIDWDGVFAVPDAALHYFPGLMGLNDTVPGIPRRFPVMVEHDRRCRRFAETVETVAQEQTEENCQDREEGRTVLLTKAGFVSKEAVAFRSLFRFAYKQDFVNRELLQGLRWMSEHNEAEVAQFYQV